MDTKATFTPGPWKFSDGFITANGKPLSLVGVSIPMTVGPTRLEAIHNSRLAAAAPDLLEALYEAREFIDAAIAKATGVQS